jgi:hypothetical protein
MVNILSSKKTSFFILQSYLFVERKGKVNGMLKNRRLALKCFNINTFHFCVFESLTSNLPSQQPLSFTTAQSDKKTSVALIIHYLECLVF